jgi:hypothetical protein
MIMNTSTRKLTYIAVVPICVFLVEQAALAQGPNLSVKATEVVTCSDPVTCGGPVTQGGILNGTSVYVFSPGATPTFDPNTLSFAYDWTLTTVQGQLKVRFVNLFSNAGIATGMGIIDSNNSSGRFAGATGVLFANGRTISNTPFTFKSEITGEINLVK